ncbi:hypothetical protein [Chitinophaga sp. MM2321]|uniref:hypothetical protein n=1 Tax=Chitinophaga sp. MM2321 TaxID=3137178 RepID=UPI0032D584D3
MEVISTIYKQLFTVKMLHPGYDPARQRFISSAIQLEPDQQTKELFTSYSMGYRFFSDTLICFVRSKLFAPPAAEPKVPYTRVSGDLLIRFLMQVSTDFLDRTVVVAAGAKRVYRFSNKVNIGTGGCISMHADGVNDDDLKNTAVVAADKTCFGVIDVFAAGAVNSAYELFGTDQQIQSPQYNVVFKSTI